MSGRNVLQKQKTETELPIKCLDYCMTDKDRQASEYSLGILSADERKDVAKMMQNDDEFIKLVDEWDNRLAPLAGAIETQALRPEVWQNIKNRMGKHNTSLPKGIEAVYKNDGQWRSVNEKVDIKSLFIDAELGAESYLLRFQPEGTIEQHSHGNWNDECIVMEGSVMVGEAEFGPGDFHVAKRGSVHPRLYSPTGCIVFVRSRQETGRCV